MSVLDQYLKEIEKEIKSEGKIKVNTEEVGTVTQVRDGVAVLSGLDNVSYGEVIQFDSGPKDMVIDLLPDGVGTVVLGDYLSIKANETARATGKILSVPVSDAVLGRVVNPLIEPLDTGS